MHSHVKFFVLQVPSGVAGSVVVSGEERRGDVAGRSSGTGDLGAGVRVGSVAVRGVGEGGDEAPAYDPRVLVTLQIQATLNECGSARE
jgi:hypothetical protein